MWRRTSRLLAAAAAFAPALPQLPPPWPSLGRPFHAAAAALLQASPGQRARAGPPPGRDTPPPGPADAARLVNGAITARVVRLVRPDNSHAVVSVRDALAEARAAGLDLVQVTDGGGAGGPPVCRLQDWAAARAAEREKEKAARRKAVTRRRAETTKELRLGLRTAPGDLRVKAAAAARALADGHKARCVVLFATGRSAGGPDGGADPTARARAHDLLAALVAAVQEVGAAGPGGAPLGRLEGPPRLDGTASLWCVAGGGGPAGRGGGLTRRGRRCILQPVLAKGGPPEA